MLNNAYRFGGVGIVDGIGGGMIGASSNAGEPSDGDSMSSAVHEASIETSTIAVKKRKKDLKKELEINSVEELHSDFIVKWYEVTFC